MTENGLSSMSYAYKDAPQEMDVFRPENVRDDAPVVVYIHGGWWQWFSKEMFSFIAQPFNEAGFAVYMPAYTLAQNWTSEEPMTRITEQLEHAMLAVFEDAQALDASQIILVGHSAGGQLVSLLHRVDWEEKYGVDRAAVDKLTHVFSLAGLFDIRALTNSYVNDAIGMSEDEAERLSPACQPIDETRAYSSLHLVLPEHDTSEFYRQTKDYQHQLVSKGIDCRLKILAGKDHVSMIETVINDGDELTSYILDTV